MPCASCRYFQIQQVPDNPAVPLEVLEQERQKGTCRRYPPSSTAVVLGQVPGLFANESLRQAQVQIQGITFWPTTWRHEECGEFEEASVFENKPLRAV